MADTIFDMYDAGLVFTGGISQLANDAAATGLDLQTLSKVLTKHGQVVATMGIARTAQLGKAFNLATQGGTELGMTFEQAQDTLLSYAEVQKMTGQLRNTSDEELIAGAKEYGMQLNRLSQVTGQRREQIDQEIKQNLKRPDVNILLSTLNDSLKESAKQGLSELQVLGPEMAGTFQDLIIAAKTGGLPAMLATNENMTQMLQQSGQMNNFMGLVDATVQGNKGAMDNFIEQIGAGSQAFAKDRALFTKMGGPLAEQVNLASGIAVQSRNISQRNQDLLNTMPVPEDGERIKQAQQMISSSFNELNQAINQFAASVLAPIAKPLAYLISGLVKAVSALAKFTAYITDYVLYPITWLGDTIASVAKSIAGYFGFDTSGGTKGDSAAGDTVQIATSVGAVLGILFGGPLIKRLLGKMFTALASVGGGMLSKVMGRLPGVGRLFGGLGAGGTGGVGNMIGGTGKLVESLKGFGTALSDTITGVAETISKVSGSLMTTIANIGKGLGGAVGGLLGGLIEGLGKGLAAIGTPQVAGAMVLGAGALGISIGLIGAGIAGATWIMGAAMPKLAEGLKAFTDIDGDKLEKTGMGMIKIGAGLIAMGVGEVASVWGSLASGIAGFFGADPITKLARFGEIAEPLQKGSDAMAAFAAAYPKSIAAINNSVIDPQAMASFDKLKEIFAGDGVFTSIGKWLFGNQDFVTQLVKLGESTDNIPLFASRITGFADAYTYLVEAFNQPLNAEALANLVGLTDLINKQSSANSPGLFGSLFGSSAPEPAAAAAPTPGVQTAAAKIAHISPDQKHQQMMDMLGQLNDTMNALLSVEDRQVRVMSDGFNSISGVVH